MSRRLVPITVEGQITEMPVMQIHLESHQPLSDILDQIKLEYIAGDRPPENRILRENLSNLEIQEENDNSNFAQCFTLHSLPASLPYAWITNIFQLCSEIQILINPVSGDEICPICGKAKSEHNPKEISDCSKQLIEMDLMRYCGMCGLTKPVEGVHDRCSKCGEKYSFSNE